MGRFVFNQSAVGKFRSKVNKGRKCTGQDIVQNIYFMEPRTNQHKYSSAYFLNILF